MNLQAIAFHRDIYQLAYSRVADGDRLVLTAARPASFADANTTGALAYAAVTSPSLTDDGEKIKVDFSDAGDFTVIREDMARFLSVLDTDTSRVLAILRIVPIRVLADEPPTTQGLAIISVADVIGLTGEGDLPIADTVTGSDGGGGGGVMPLPILGNDSAMTDVDTPVLISPLVNDVDPEGDNLRVVLVQSPAHGTVRIASETGFEYVPAAGFTGADSFLYGVITPDGRAAQGAVTITVANTIPTRSLTVANGAAPVAVGFTASGEVVNNQVTVTNGLTAGAVERFVPGGTGGAVLIYGTNFDAAAVGANMQTVDAGWSATANFFVSDPDGDGNKHMRVAASAASTNQRDLGRADVRVSVKVFRQPNTVAYPIMLRRAADAQNWIGVRFDGNSEFIVISKRVNGGSVVVNAWPAIPIAGGVQYPATLEAEVVGATLKAFYNGAQQGSDMTIGDASLLSNTYAGQRIEAGGATADPWIDDWNAYEAPLSGGIAPSWVALSAGASTLSVADAQGLRFNPLAATNVNAGTVTFRTQTPAGTVRGEDVAFTIGTPGGGGGQPNPVQGNLIPNGDFASADLTGWSSINGAVPTVVNGRLELTLGQSQTYGRISRAVSVVAGETYDVAVSGFKDASATNWNWRIASASSGDVSTELAAPPSKPTNTGEPAVTSTGVFTSQFTGTVYFVLMADDASTASGKATFDDVSMVARASTAVGQVQSAMLAMPDQDIVPFAASFDAAATNLTVAELPTAPIIGLHANNVFTPVTLGQVLTRAQALTLAAKRVPHRTWMWERFRLVVNGVATPYTLERTFRMTVPWAVSYPVLSETQCDVLASTWRYAEFGATQFNYSQYLNFLWANPHVCDWLDASGVEQGPAPHAVLSTAGAGATVSANVTAFVQAYAKGATLPKKDGTSDAIRCVQMLFPGSTGQGYHGVGATTASQRPRIVYRQGGANGTIVATITALYGTVPSGTATETEFKNPSVMTPSNGRSMLLEFDVPTAGWDHAELQLTVQGGTATRGLHLMKPRTGLRVFTGADTALVRDPTLAASDVLFKLTDEATFATYTKHPNTGTGTALNQYFSPDVSPSQPGSGYIHRYLGNGRVINGIPRYRDASEGRVGIMLPRVAGGPAMAREDQPYHKELWLRFEICLLPSFQSEFGYTGKGLGTIATTYEADASSARYNPTGVNDPLGIIPSQQGGYGGAQISDGTFSTRIRFDKGLPEDHPFHGMVSGFGLYAYYHEMDGKRSNPSGVAHTQRHYHARYPYRHGHWMTITTYTKVNTHIQDPANTQTKNGEPIYGTPNPDGIFRLWIEDNLVIDHKGRGLILQDLPNFGIRELGQVIQAYFGGVGYGDSTGLTRQLHLFGGGNYVVSKKCLGLGAIP